MRRTLDGRWTCDPYCHAWIDDDFAHRSGLSALAERQTGPPEIQRKTGWPIVRLVSLDFANPQMAAKCRREIERIMPALQPANARPSSRTAAPKLRRTMDGHDIGSDSPGAR